jgi:GAF domain-containing protein
MDPGELLKRIERLNEVGIALSAEQDKTRLLELILTAAKELTGADAGTLYSMVEGKSLRFEIIRNDTLNFAWIRGVSENTFPTADIPLYKEGGSPNDHMIVVYAVVHDQTVNIPDAYSREDYEEPRKGNHRGFTTHQRQRSQDSTNCAFFCARPRTRRIFGLTSRRCDDQSSAYQ